MNIYSPELSMTTHCTVLTMLYKYPWPALLDHRSQLGVFFSQMNIFEKYSKEEISLRFCVYLTCFLSCPGWIKRSLVRGWRP